MYDILNIYGRRELNLINIDHIMELININSPSENQKKGIFLSKNIKCIDIFLMPKYPYGQDIWENCAKIITDKNDSELMPYLERLFHWVEDLNIPGAHIIMNRLKNMEPSNQFNSLLKKCIKESKLINNEAWNKNLSEIEKSNQKDIVSEKYILKLLDCNMPRSSQERGIQLGLKAENIRFLIAPKNNIDTWENCAKILFEKEDQQIIDYIFELFKWLQDKNCPPLILERLKMLKNNKRVLAALEICIKKSNQEGKNSWSTVLLEIEKSIVKNFAETIYLTDIDYILNLLKWENKSKDQQKGIELGKNLKCINAFILPIKPYSKEIWENCAKILYSKEDIELEEYLFDLLEWLQDLNWPGALIIEERLNKYKKDIKMKTAIEESLLKSKLEKDKEWEKNLLTMYKLFKKS